MKPFAQLRRTHTCGELRKEHIGARVTLNGWVYRYRDLGGLLFIDLRDRYGLTQLVFNPDIFDKEQMKRAAHLRAAFVITVSGKVQPRPEGMVNSGMPTGEIEVIADEFEILAEAETPPFEIEDEVKATEELRLTYRYLDLRRQPLQDKIIKRHRLSAAIREHLNGQGFLDIETPLLMRSTPEGARDYVVPSRVFPGKFYALPQSPQLFKQILIISGFDRYYQLARCLRDEDLRADRQPEHTQIDIEMGFVTQDDVFAAVEPMMVHAFKKVLDVDLQTPFPRLSYAEVMSKYGSDKPDLRFGLEFVDFSEVFTNSEFKVFSSAIEGGGVVKGIVVPGQAGLSRKQISEIEEEAKRAGAKGLAWIAFGEELKSPIKKFLGDSEIASIKELGNVDEGDLVLFGAGPKLATETILGRVRSYCGKQFDLIDRSLWRFLWVTDFPLFEYHPETDRFDAMHNIVTSPNEAQADLLEAGFTTKLPAADPNHPWALLTGNQYDLVCNGWELGSGGIRNHRRDLQLKILNVLGLDDKRAENMFGFLLTALKYGAPPHGGIALGLDRIAAIMTGTESIRDVIAFPKTTAAQSLMDGSPTPIEAGQLSELGLAIAVDSDDQ
ncbi:MAG: aspartate--tRNA ligase [bacterium]